MKLIYTPPYVGIVSFETENGFAQSGGFDVNNKTEIFTNDADYKF